MPAQSKAQTTPSPGGNPFGAYRFSLELDGTKVAEFLEMSGLKTSAEVFEIIEGGLNGVTHKRTGVSKWGNITLKYATSASTFLLEWRDRYVQDGFAERTQTSGSIVMIDNDGEEMRRFSFSKCWPVSWEGPNLNSGTSEIGIETLEIAFDELLIDSKFPPEPPPQPPPPKPVPAEFKTEPVQFDLNSSNLKPEGKKTLNKLAEDLKANPDVTKIWISGHTCDLGPRGYNEGLSQKRADACKKELEKADTGGKTFESKGYAWDYPMRANDSEPNRAINRRTQFFTSARSGLRPNELPYVKYPGK